MEQPATAAEPLSVAYRRNTADEQAMLLHFLSCRTPVFPRLATGATLPSYVSKIHACAERFEAWHESALVGLVAAYMNDASSRCAFVTSVAVHPGWMGLGIATHLMKMCIDGAMEEGMTMVTLEVEKVNAPAVNLYKRIGFEACDVSDSALAMTLRLDTL